MLMSKPTVKLSGEDGNIFSIMARVARALKAAGQPDNAKKMQTEVMQSGSYDEALQVVMKYVEVE
jgi:hypothetical protein